MPLREISVPKKTTPEPDPDHNYGLSIYISAYFFMITESFSAGKRFLGMLRE